MIYFILSYANFFIYMYLVGLWEGLDVLGKFWFFLMGGYPFFVGGESGLAGFGGDFCLGWTEDMTKNGGEYLFQPKSGVEGGKWI